MQKKETDQEFRERRLRETKQQEDRMHCSGNFVNAYDTSPPLGQHRFELPASGGGMMHCIRCGFVLGRR